MNATGFRRIVLGLAGVIEGAHMGHPDFRVGGRIFATLTADESTGMVKLPVDQQARFLAADSAFRPASGAWGLQGSTLIDLHRSDEEVVGEAATIAWQNVSAGSRKEKRPSTAKKPNRARSPRT